MKTPVKIETKTITEGRKWSIVATYADGHNSVFGDVITERGAAAKITQYAKRFGLTKTDKFTATK